MWLFFASGLFFCRVTHDRLSERGITRSLFWVIRLENNKQLDERRLFLKILKTISESHHRNQPDRILRWYMSSGREWAESGKKIEEILIIPSLLLLPRLPRDMIKGTPKPIDYSMSLIITRLMMYPTNHFKGLSCTSTFGGSYRTSMGYKRPGICRTKTKQILKLFVLIYIQEIECILWCKGMASRRFR